MKKSITWRFILIAVTLALAFIYFLPNTPLFAYMPGLWKKNMPSKGIVLGLDLQGGIHLVFEVQADKAVELTTDRVVQSLRDLISKKKLTAELKREGLLIVATPASNEIRDAIEKNFPSLAVVETSRR